MFKDLTGCTFGRLQVLHRADNKSNHTYWLCECQCKQKTLKTVRGTHLTSGRIQSCGCLYRKRMRSNVPPNIFKIQEGYNVGHTDKGEEFYFDIDDTLLVEKYNWYFDKDGYVIARINGKCIKLHKLIINTDCKIDHINRCRFDNRKNNLRVVDNSQNGMNVNVRKDNTSGVTGVGWSKNYNRWRSRITLRGKEILLGYFDKFDDAVMARREAELKYFGEYSPLYINSLEIN